jgi:hypothetical protein
MLSLFAIEYVCHRLYERKTCSTAAQLTVQEACKQVQCHCSQFWKQATAFEACANMYARLTECPKTHKHAKGARMLVLNLGYQQAEAASA